MNYFVAISTIFISYKTINYIYKNYEIILFKIIYNYHYCSAIIINNFFKNKKNIKIKNENKGDNNFEKVSYNFLLIEYIDPNNKSDTLLINIPKNELYIGNKILSKKYVFNYLTDINKISFINIDYKIKILDENMNEIYLDIYSYILLEKDNYKIKIKNKKYNT